MFSVSIGVLFKNPLGFGSLQSSGTTNSGILRRNAQCTNCCLVQRIRVTTNMFHRQTSWTKLWFEWNGIHFISHLGQLEGKQPQLGDLLTMVTNHLLTGMILQVGGSNLMHPPANYLYQRALWPPGVVTLVRISMFRMGWCMSFCSHNAWKILRFWWWTFCRGATGEDEKS